MRDFAKYVEEIKASGRYFEAWPTGRYSEDPLYVERALRQGLDLGIITCKDFGVIPLAISLCRDQDSIVVVVEFDEPPAGSLYWEGKALESSRAV